MNNLDLSKYKRLFVFGCSFTSYLWPTWADIISKEMPHAEFNNFGHCGAGNLLISVRITEANQRYAFTEDDLIIVMWTTFCREDRYRNNSWMHTGNIYTARHDYSDEFVKKYADSKGYLIRDLAIITMTTALLKTLPATTLTLSSVPFNYQQETSDESIGPILKLYKDTCESTPPNLLEFEMENNWTNGHAYINNGEKYSDYHPNPLRYCNYLKKIGFPISQIGEEYARSSTVLLHGTKTTADINAVFVDLLKGKERFML